MEHPIQRLKKYLIPLGELSAVPLHFGPMYLHRSTVPLTRRVTFGPHSRQYLLYFHPPAGASVRKQWVMFFHGGGWYAGAPGMFSHIIDFFTGAGYPLVLPAYRLCPRFGFRDMREDIGRALLETQRLIREVCGSEQGKIVVGGMSAGANLAAHLVFNTGALRDLGIEDYPFSGFLSCGGPLDLHGMPDTFIVRTFTGSKRGAAAFQTANPFELISPESPRLSALFISGNRDTIVPMRAHQSFYEAYKAHTGCGRWLELDGKHHIDTIRWIHDDTPTAHEVLKWMDHNE
jgi:acetyl esterase/lipase